MYKFWIVYNGEIYNYLEIREELINKGYKFKSNCDTEIILASYIEWGEDCLNKFNGMWSFAILDIQKKELFCARDRLGIKPFYYYYDNNYFCFGSEIKQIISLPWVNTGINSGIVFDFIAFNTYGCNSESTFFKNIFDLRGGHLIKLNLNNKERISLQIKKWWDINLSKRIHFNNEKDYIRNYYELFEDSIKLRLRSDVEVGSCLSGGLDSSGIVCMVNKIYKEKGISNLLKTFTASSEHKECDETDYANEVISNCRVESYFVIPTAERLFKEIDKLIWHQDEPFSSTSIFASWCVYKLAKDSGVKVTLDGQGPDEMMGGYVPFVYQYYLLDLLTKREFALFFREINSLKENLGLSYNTIFKSLFKSELHGRVPKYLMPSIKKAKNIFNKDFFHEGFSSSEFVKSTFNYFIKAKEKGSSRFNYFMYDLVIHGSLPGILRQVDRNSMANSIEARLPFLDYRLVEYTFSLPDHMKFRNGSAKFVYREAMKNILPKKIYDRKTKLGFVTAEPIWVSKNKNIFVETFENVNENIFVKDYYKGLLHSLDKKMDYDSLIWRIYSIKKWITLFNLSTNDI
jgi:asparagine synthase (glutamine-hydrolysing)